MTPNELARKTKFYANPYQQMYDEYLAVFPDGTYLTMSKSPRHPQGICQHGMWESLPPLMPDEQELHFTELPEQCREVIIEELEERADITY